MEGRPPWRICDDVQLSNRISLAVLRHNVYPALFTLSDRSQTAIDHDVHGIADIFRSPQDLASVDMYPVEGRVDVED